MCSYIHMLIHTLILTYLHTYIHVLIYFLIGNDTDDDSKLVSGSPHYPYIHPASIHAESTAVRGPIFTSVAGIDGYVYIYTCIHTCIHAYMYVIYTYVYSYIHILIQINIHTYIYPTNARFY